MNNLLHLAGICDEWKAKPSNVLLQTQFMIELLTSLLLADFSSGSSINFYHDRFYLIGDDASQILILDHAYHQVGSVTVFHDKAARIPKNVKADFETAAMVKVEDKDHLFVLGSASRANRMSGVLLPLEESKGKTQSGFTTISLADFISRIKQLPVGEINLEGSAVVGNHFVLSNRANGDHPANTFIITASDFWTQQLTAPVQVCKLILPETNREVLGVSELCYVPSSDRLLLTLSSEQTNNAYEDGAIGDSYIGWMNSFSTKMNGAELTLDGMINLPQSNVLFKGEKIEGICVERVENNELTVHLVSDNDDGRSRLFKIKLTIK